MVYNEQSQFYGYDSGDVSNHGYDYESDDLPTGCHFEDDDIRSLAPAPAPSTATPGPAAALQRVAPAHAPAPHPHRGLCSQHPSALSNNTFTRNATLDDHTECRGLVCHPVAARVKPDEQRRLSSGVIAAIVICSVLGAALLLYIISFVACGPAKRRK